MENKREPESRSFVGSLARTLALLSTFTILVMLAVIVIGFFCRALRISLSGVNEATEFLVLIGIFLGFSYVQYRNTHIKMELLTPYFPMWLRSAVGTLSSLMAFGFFSVIMFGGIISGWESYSVGEYEVGLRSVPMWIVRSFIPIGSFAVILVSLADLLARITNLLRKAGYSS
jgi:TRAP-type C4-dicarboxylate transport system permease small subunit